MMFEVLFVLVVIPILVFLTTDWLGHGPTDSLKASASHIKDDELRCRLEEEWLAHSAGTSIFSQWKHARSIQRAVRRGNFDVPTTQIQPDMESITGSVVATLEDVTCVASGSITINDTYKYQFKIGNKIVHGGITNDLERREQEHQQKYGEKGHIKQVGNRTTEEAARKWEKDKGYT